MTVLVMGCDSSPSGVTENENNNGNNSNNGDDTEEVTEPTLSIGDLTDGAEASGELVFTINGEAGEGFAELRILLDEEEIASASDPAMPYEQTLQTFAYDNGDYELTVELDVAGGDSTLSETVAVHFENYLMRIDTDGYIRSTIDNNDYFNLYISDPDGNILGVTDLSGNAGMVGLVPPEALEEAPDYFNVTIVTENESYTNSADTYSGLEPWVTVWDGSGSSSSSSGTEYNKELRVEISNPSFNPQYWGTVSEYVDNYSSEPENESYGVSLSVSPEANNLLSYMIPDTDVEDNLPRYYWEKDLQSLDLSRGNTIHYDATTDFQKMSVHDIAHSSDLEVSYYNLYMSADTDSWSSGSLWVPAFGSASQFDQSASSSVYGVPVPESDHLFDLRMIMYSKSNLNISHQMESDALPAEFQTVDAEVNQAAFQNISDVSLGFTGSLDFARLIIVNDNSGHENSWSWSVYVSDSQKSFTPPKITEEFNWELFNVVGVEMVTAEGINGFEDYLSYHWSDSDLSISSANSKLVSFDSQTKRKRGGLESINQPKQGGTLLLGERHRPVKVLRKQRP